ncbi:hypothetical protein, partial [Mesorhizobium sp.]|uniref:hypothetical protein n=1 Tax=Mesorhizobium sp. TaxID=1871066 RepID=UPI00257E0FFF
ASVENFKKPLNLAKILQNTPPNEGFTHSESKSLWDRALRPASSGVIREMAVGRRSYVWWIIDERVDERDLSTLAPAPEERDAD